MQKTALEFQCTVRTRPKTAPEFQRTLRTRQKTSLEFWRTILPRRNALLEFRATFGGLQILASGFSILYPPCPMAEKGPAAKVAIIGVQGAGKTTLFCALTGMDASRAAAHQGKTAAAAVRILDPRLLAAHEKNGPEKKLVAPSLEFIDTPALWLDGPQKQDNPGVFAQFRDADGFVVVLKAYDLSPEALSTSPAKGGTAKGEDPRSVAAQLEAIKGELFVADIDVMQKRIEKLRPDVKKPLPNRDELQRELAVLERLADAVSGGDTKAFASLTEEDEKKIKGFQFFSRKPIIPLANIAEADLAKPPFTPAAALKLEMELLAMEEAERAGFMGDYGLTSLVVTRYAIDCFDKMHLQTFLTLGDKDTTGWAVRKGASALEASGKIHTDIQKGFINMEVIPYAELEKAPNPHAARAKHRIEGKAYVMRDFDIVNVKFNV